MAAAHVRLGHAALVLPAFQVEFEDEENVVQGGPVGLPLGEVDAHFRVVAPQAVVEQLDDFQEVRLVPAIDLKVRAGTYARLGQHEHIRMRSMLIRLPVTVLLGGATLSGRCSAQYGLR